MRHNTKVGRPEFASILYFIHRTTLMPFNQIRGTMLVSLDLGMRLGSAVPRGVASAHQCRNRRPITMHRIVPRRCNHVITVVPAAGDDLLGFSSTVLRASH
jgi:hypothetical protein